MKDVNDMSRIALIGAIIALVILAIFFAVIVNGIREVSTPINNVAVQSVDGGGCQ